MNDNVVAEKGSKDHNGHVHPRTFKEESHTCNPYLHPPFRRREESIDGASNIMDRPFEDYSATLVGNDEEEPLSEATAKKG